jgi:hypothetical protein
MEKATMSQAEHGAHLWDLENIGYLSGPLDEHRKRVKDASFVGINCSRSKVPHDRRLHLTHISGFSKAKCHNVIETR